MLNINDAWAIYIGTRVEMGRDHDALELVRAEDGQYYLLRDEGYPITLGAENDAVDALLAAAFGLRNA